MGIIFGLALYAVGALLIIPATNLASFHLFLFAFFVLACGIGSLETSANPYMVKLGDEKMQVLESMPHKVLMVWDNL